MKNIATTHNAFLNSLPDAKIKSVILRTILIAMIGFPVAIVSFVIIGMAVGFTGITNQNYKFIFTILVQDIPLFLLTLAFFYKKEIKNIFPVLFAKNSFKSILLIISLLLLNLILGVLIVVVSYFTFNDPGSLKAIEAYVGRGEDKITLTYLYTFSQTFLIFLTVAFFEEFIFRFTLYRFLRERGLLIALILSSVIFGLIHGTNGIVGALVFGFTIALYYEYTNYFLGAVVFHALHNLLVVYYTYYIAFLILQSKIG